MQFPDPNSIVDFLKNQGKPSDYNSRAALYESQGLGSQASYIAAGVNNAQQNTALLNSLRGSSRPSTNSGFSGSAMHPQGNATLAATMAGGNALTTTTPSTGPNQGSQRRLYQGQDGRYYDETTGQPVDTGRSNTGGSSGNETDPLEALMRQQNASRETQAAASRQMVDLNYSTQLASQNQQYATAFQDLQNQHQKALDVAHYQSASMNPYGGPSSAQQGYLGKIDSEFNTQAGRLTQMGQQAQDALANSRQSAYLEIQNQMAQSQDAFNANMTQTLMQIRQQQKQDEQFNIQQQNVWADNFTNQLQKINYTPEQVDAKIKNGTIYQDPTFQAGLKGGFNPQGVIDSMKSGSMAAQNLLLNQQKATDLQAYRDNQLALGWARLASSADKQTQQQIIANVIASVGSVPYPGTSATSADWNNYYKQVAQASSGGKTDFRISEGMSNLQSTISQLPDVKKGIEALSDSDPIRNLVASRIPYAEKVQKLQGEINRILGTVARGVMSERGVLTDADIERAAKAVGTIGQTADVRSALFNELVNIMSEKYRLNLGSYARQGYDVSAFAPVLDTISTLQTASTVGRSRFDQPDNLSNWIDTINQ